MPKCRVHGVHERLRVFPYAAYVDVEFIEILLWFNPVFPFPGPLSSPFSSFTLSSTISLTCLILSCFAFSGGEADSSWTFKSSCLALVLVEKSGKWQSSLERELELKCKHSFHAAACASPTSPPWPSTGCLSRCINSCGFTTLVLLNCFAFDHNVRLLLNHLNLLLGKHQHHCHPGGASWTPFHSRLRFNQRASFNVD